MDFALRTLRPKAYERLFDIELPAAESTIDDRP